MSPRRPKLPKIGLPASPLHPVRGALAEAHKRIDQARQDIRSVADDLHSFSILGHSSITPIPVAGRQTPRTDIATACVPCALGHFSTSAGLLNEAVRFRDEGITSNEILDRIAKVLEEQNTLERKDLTQEQIQSAPPWEREIAEEALSQSRKLRHSLENFTSISQIEQAAADTSKYYRELNRKWFKQRFAHLGPEKAERIAEEASKLTDEAKETISRFIEERESKGR